MAYWPAVIVATPAHSQLSHALSYACERALTPGTLVRVPLGKRDTLGVVASCSNQLPEGIKPEAVKPISEVLDGIAPLSAQWLQLVGFAAKYYQRGLGEVALAALPPELRKLDPTQLARRLKRNAKLAQASTKLVEDAIHETGAAPITAPPSPPPDTTSEQALAASPEQAQALASIATATLPTLLFGTTGSGKTEVYLQTAAALLAREPNAQVLVLVPEINLTPQLEGRFTQRFASFGVVSLHSGLTPAQRLQNWLSAHMGHARIVLGTRMAVFASMPQLRLIVVDEEHDPSYKSQEGARYSARDLAVYRSHSIEGCQVLLGSATPSLETWHAAQTGRYQRLSMPSRIGGAALPALRLVDMGRQPKQTVIAQNLLDAIAQRAQRGEQSLLLLNRRGYAPVLSCGDCGWKSQCPHCSAHRVFHKIDRSLRCHHCGLFERVPRACPDCGNVDIQTIGRGTEQLEELLADKLAKHLRPDGHALRVARLDADTTRNKGELTTQLAAMHAGEVDVLVGTQMVAKGHDFRGITLVAAINPDGALFASDFRAPERLFALLMQAAGRAGRDATKMAALKAQGATGAELWVQTWHPTHPLFAALAKHDYPGFADSELREREAAMLPPFASQALLRADAKSQAAAQTFLNQARDAANDMAEHMNVGIYPAVPLNIARVANVERAQMLVECANRATLQKFLAQWQQTLHNLRATPAGKAIIRWAIDVDPLAI
jgi:primosomal protein N' (replication factor Y) (superfamily II helicase)